MNHQASYHHQAWIIWLVTVSFLLFQFFLQLSSGVILDSIKYEMQYSALATGMLSASFYYIYTALQIPVGLLFDRYHAKWLLSSTAFITAISCLFFALSHSFTGLFLNRLLMGAGAAFAFVGMSHIIRLCFAPPKFAFMIGLSETLGFLSTVVGMISMSVLISLWGWRSFMFAAGLLGLVISFFCAKKIPLDKQSTHKKQGIIKELKHVIGSPIAWANGMYCGLGFSVITVFASLWVIPFIKLKLQYSLFLASCAGAMIFIGAAAGLPLFGNLYTILPRRKPLMLGSSLLSAFLILLFLYFPSKHFLSNAIILLSIGLSCGGYILAFAVSNELAPKHSQSTWTGFTNTLSMITAPLLQPLIGFILDHRAASEPLSVADYQTALSLIPLGLIIASILVGFLPEKKPATAFMTAAP